MVLTHSILGNLLSNAIKFSHSQQVITVSFSKSRDEFCFTVSDSGVGIPEALRSQIFKRHGISSRKGTGGEIGTGFGMPIVKMLTELMQGHVELKSRTEDTPTPQEPRSSTISN